MSQKFISFLDRLIIFILHNYGLFPNSTNTNCYWILSYIYHFFFSFLFCCGAMIYAVLNITDAKKSTDALSTTLVILAFILKMINYQYYRKRIFSFVSKLYEMQVLESPDEIELSKGNMKFISGICYFFWGCGHLTIFIGSFKAFRKENPEMVLVSWFPWDPWGQNATAFWIAYLYSMINGVVIMQLNITLDCFSSFLMETIATQFHIVGLRLQKLSKDVSDSIELNKLVVCVKHHQHLLRLVDEMECFLSMQFFVQIILSGIIFCSGVYQLTSMNMPEEYLQFFNVAMFMVCIAFQSFSFTYFGNRIITSSDAISNSVYFSPWYEMPVIYQRHLILLMERAKRKRVILAGKLFEMNLTLFTTIMSFSHRLYALRSSVAHK